MLVVLTGQMPAQILPALAPHLLWCGEILIMLELDLTLEEHLA
jgi:hypothetical protein